MHALLAIAALTFPTGAPAPVGDIVPRTIPPLEEASEEPAWSGGVTIGLFDASGNTVRSSANLTGDAERRREEDRTTFGAWWSWAEEENTAGLSSVSERRVGGKAQYDRFFSGPSYVYGNASADADHKANLDLRWTVGAGYGRQFREEEALKVSAELGLSWFNEAFGAAAANEYATVRVAYNIDWVPQEKWTLSQGAELFPSIEASDDVYTKLDSRVRYDVNGSIYAQLQWVWDWDNTPATGLERSDQRVFVTVGWTF
jgi:putative salt-induced outer membrane protein